MDDAQKAPAPSAETERAVEVAAGLTKAERQIVGSYTPETYAINFPRDRVERLVKVGVLEWLPPVWGNAHNWGLAPLGRLVARSLKGEG